jgi:hypothetical protein
MLSFRLEPEWREDIDEWRKGEPGNLSRSEAIRVLIAMGLIAAHNERKQAEQAARKRG